MYIHIYVCLHTNEAEKVKHQTQNGKKKKRVSPQNIEDNDTLKKQNK